MNLSEPLEPSAGRPTTGGGLALVPGALLEDFEIVEVLAQSAHSVVYLAHHVVEAGQVVIKEYLPSALVLRDAEGAVQPADASKEALFRRGLESFTAEALALSQFDHSHLLHVSSVWESNGTAYRTMPYLTGMPLSAYRAQLGKPMEQSQLTQLRNGLLAALQVIHTAGLTHDQVEPNNIMWTESGGPVLMDFGATGLALQRNDAAHIDAFANPALTREITGTDLRSVAAVLHFALSGDWASPCTERNHRYEPLADVLLRFKDSASALGYEPEFTAAIDTALSQPPVDRPRSVSEMQALFEPKPADLSPPPQATTKLRPNPTRTELPPKTAPVRQLNSTQSVLSLLAQFNHGEEPAQAAEDVEPFKPPVVPTLTEEAEPALPPMRVSLFDAIEAGEDLPQDGVAFKSVAHQHHTAPPIPRTRASRWQRWMPALKFGGFVLACAAALGWLLTS